MPSLSDFLFNGPLMPQGSSGLSQQANNFLFGSGPQTQQLQRFTPQQTNALNSLLSQSMSGLQALQNQPNQQKFDFAPIANQARTQFNTQTVPSLAERFTALGNGQRSSAFQGALGQAASGLEGNLAALQQQYGLQNRSLDLQQQGMQQNLLQNLLGISLTPQYETVYQPQQQGFLGTAGAGLAQGLGSVLPLLLAGSGAGLPLAAGGGLAALLGLLSSSK
jgi:hypothetical protein